MILPNIKKGEYQIFYPKKAQQKGKTKKANVIEKGIQNADLFLFFISSLLIIQYFTRFFINIAPTISSFLIDCVKI